MNISLDQYGYSADCQATACLLPASKTQVCKRGAMDAMRILYLTAIVAWHAREVLAWRITNMLEARFCVDALNEAIHKFGSPDTMTTDQGYQFTFFHELTGY